MFNDLENLVDTLERNGFLVRPYLRPGLSKSQIEMAIVPLGITFPTELFSLYQWHDGIDEIEDGEMLFGEHQFLSLSDAIAAYQKIVHYYHDPYFTFDITKCFPYACFEGSYNAIYCGDGLIKGLSHPIVRIFQGVGIEFESLEIMVRTINECFAQGVFSSQSDDEILYRDILQRLNPKIYYGDTTL